VAAPNVFVGKQAPAAKPRAGVPYDSAVAPLTLVGGLALVAASLVDIALAWYPVGIGNAEWEFGTITATLNGLPLLTIGAVLALHGAVAMRRRWFTRSFCVGLWLFVAFLLGCGFIYATDVPIALKNVTEPLARTGLIRAVAKAGFLLVVFIATYTVLSVQAWRSTANRG